MEKIFNWVVVPILLGLFSNQVNAQNIIDYNHIYLDQIPEEWIEAAKDNLHIYFGHRSHGEQITRGGMAALRRYSPEFNDLYAYNSDGSDGALHIYEEDFIPPDEGWVTGLRNYLDANPTCNVVIYGTSYSFVTQGGNPGSLNGFNNAMEMINVFEQLDSEYGIGGSLGREHPVTFVFTTPIPYSRFPLDLDRTPDEYNIGTFWADSLIIDHAKRNNRYVFDYYALSTHDPDGTNFGSVNEDFTFNDDRRPMDDATYADPDDGSTRNWGNEWIADNPGTENALMSAVDICTECAHSDGRGTNYRGETADSRLQCVMKGKAIWYLWARLAGWEGDTAEIAVTDITISSEGNATEITASGGTLQMYAEVLPVNATNPDIVWSVQNGTGQASVSTSGLVTAIADGSVTITASATDGSGITGTFQITISNQSTTEINPGKENEVASFVLLDNKIYFTDKVQTINLVRLISTDGKLIAAYEGADINNVSLPESLHGVYILQFLSNNLQLQNEILFIP